VALPDREAEVALRGDSSDHAHKDSTAGSDHAGDAWDIQDVEPLDAPTFLAGLKEESAAGTAPASEEPAEEGDDPDADEVEARVLEQVQSDQEADRRAVAGAAPALLAPPPAEAMSRAAASQRARAITSASRPSDSFK